MENKIESRTDKLVPQPNDDHHDGEFSGNLNDTIVGAISKKIGQATDHDNAQSLKDAVVIANTQQSSNTKLDDQEYEQLYSHVQQRVNDAINALTDAQSDLARLLASDISHAFATNKKICDSYNSKHHGITTDGYNTVTKAISDLKFKFRSLW